jgi:hypothetical protein
VFVCAFGLFGSCAVELCGADAEPLVPTAPLRDPLMFDFVPAVPCEDPCADDVPLVPTVPGFSAVPLVPTLPDTEPLVAAPL